MLLAPGSSDCHNLYIARLMNELERNSNVTLSKASSELSNFSRSLHSLKASAGRGSKTQQSRAALENRRSARCGEGSTDGIKQMQEA
jgi:hypothetical protein